MATRDYIPLMKRAIVVLGTTGAGKSSVANHIMTNAGQRPIYEVSSRLGIRSVRKQADMSEMTIEARRIYYVIRTVDTHGFLDTGGKSTNSQDLATIKELLKDKVPEGVSLVIFVFKKGPYINQEMTTLQFIIDNFRKEVSDIFALVVTCCEGLDANDRRRLINDLKTNAETKSMIEFMGKGIFPVGFPPMEYLTSNWHALFEEDVAADRQMLRELVYDCDKMYLPNEIWKEDFSWQSLMPSMLQFGQKRKLKNEGASVALHQSQQRVRQLEERLERKSQENEALETQWVVQRNEIGLTREELGRGGWAAVKVAVFRGTRVAAKCFFQQIVSPYNCQLFRREMNMASRIRHPNLVQFVGATLQGEMIILTELMPTSLRAVLEQRAISHNEITSISLDVARALNYLHLMQPQPVVHRDISSANVLLEPGLNNSWKAKVSDYGSVNQLQSLQTKGAGNPTYAAPEANTRDQQTPKMDIFSFGVLLIEMCTDQFPELNEREEQIESITDPRFLAVVKRCLDESKDKRPTAAELIAEFQR